MKGNLWEKPPGPITAANPSLPPVPRCKGHNYHVFGLGADECSMCGYRRFHPEAKLLTWTPTRKGSVYCSPACGGGCTESAYRAALKASAALCRKLGHGFRPEVWENLGWHWKVYSPPLKIEVRGLKPGGYSARSKGSAGFKHKTAVGAILAVREAFEDAAFRIKQEVDRLRQFQPPKKKATKKKRKP